MVKGGFCILLRLLNSDLQYFVQEDTNQSTEKSCNS